VWLPLDPKVAGSNPAKGFLRAIKIRSTPSFEWEVKSEVPCRKILRHVKDLLTSHGDGQTKFSFLRPFSYSLQRCLCWQDRQTVLVACQSALVDKLGVCPSRYHHTMIHVAITRGWTIGRSSETSVSPHHSQSTTALHHSGSKLLIYHGLDVLQFQMVLHRGRAYMLAMLAWLAFWKLKVIKRNFPG
jgi:hypothetical protein